MSVVSNLESIQKFLKDKIAADIKLQKPTENINQYELTNPQVHIGWIPPKGYLPEEMESSIPCLIVGLDDGSDDGEEGTLNIRISAVVYSPGTHKINDKGQMEFTPDFNGYVDLLNLLEKTKAEILKNQIINGLGIIQYPVKYGMYQQEQPYPFWYGWITFSIKKASYPQSEISKFL